MASSSHSRKPKDPTNIVSIKYLREAFEIKGGELYWCKDRPDYHFHSENQKKLYRKNRAGKPAGTKNASIGYYQIRINLTATQYIFLYGHRIIFALTHGFWPPNNLYVDHKTRQPLANDPSQLRLATPEQNASNHSRPPVRTYYGVYPTNAGHWVCRVLGKHLGTFKNEEEAAIARDKYLVVIGRGKWARLNFPAYYDAANDTYKPKDIAA